MAKGEQHRQQRRILNPAFGPAQIRELTSIYVEKAHQLRDLWRDEILKRGLESAQIDIFAGLTQAALDMIGLAGFHHEFGALSSQNGDELIEAVHILSQLASKLTANFLRFVKCYIPSLRFIPDPIERQANVAQGIMRRIGTRLVAESKATIANARKGEKGVRLDGRDLLTLLIKANMSLAAHQQLCDEDVIAQIVTFLVAGHDTTAHAVAWSLYALACAPQVQRKLREELLHVRTENPSMDELNELPYLDAFVREVMRVHSPVPVALRQADKADMIPLAHPVVDERGQVHDVVRIQEGQTIVIPIANINTSKDLWGEDALEFKPERWLENIPETIQQVPGAWANLMTFMGGPRACIGFRFALAETKALLFSLVSAFEFEPSTSHDAIFSVSSILERPYVQGEEEKGPQLPLLLKPYQRS
ncbi:uncharacterized protein FIBRA_06307 [Fibroporia radiculosa]|uniref:Cytochrome P450 n=1 Tax=Fibroporia radiculosa TaxID=599839 RepID=J4GSI3_9APHY|nr:uncharacterized protein FIBRA_06307 [Fibroporia radiculosa]CCM04145.1 predicted protein [Fibroporia radiculosa]